MTTTITERATTRQHQLTRAKSIYLSLKRPRAESYLAARGWSREAIEWVLDRLAEKDPRHHG